MHLTRRAVTFALAVVLVATAVQGQQTSLSTLQPVPVTQIDRDPRDPQLDGVRVSFRAASPTPVRSALLRLVRDTNLSVVAAPSITQTFVGDLKNLTIREALDAILTPLDLDYAVQAQIIRVFPRELETRFYSVDYVITQRTGSRVIPGRRDGAAVVSATDSPNVYAELTEGVRVLLSPEGRMNLDRTAALLQVSDRPGRLLRVEEYLETAMLRAARQVQIEASVIEVALRSEFRNGLDWRAVLSGVTGAVSTPGPVAPPTRSTLTLAPNVTDFNALLEGLAAQGTVNVLSSPRIIAMNNEPAVVRAGTDDGQSLTGGIVLSVTPQISADGIVHLSINPRVTGAAGTIRSRAGDDVPITTVREADTMVRVRDGGTVVIAGLMQERGDRKTDLVILLTPTVVRPAGAR